MKTKTLKLTSLAALALATGCQQDNLADVSQASPGGLGSSTGMTAEVSSRATCYFDGAFQGGTDETGSPSAAQSTELSVGTVLAIPNVADKKLIQTTIGKLTFTDATFIRVRAGSSQQSCYVDVKKLSARMTALADGVAVVPMNATDNDALRNPSAACYLNRGDVVTFLHVLALENGPSAAPKPVTINGKSVIIRITRISSGRANASPSEACQFVEQNGDGRVDLKSFKEGEIILRSPFHRG